MITSGGKTMTVYADVLFLINFSMDFLTLYFTGKIAHKPMKTYKICISAAIGGLLGTAVSIFTTRNDLLASVLTSVVGIAVSFLMTRVAYGKYTTIKRLARDGVILWGGGALLGGVMTSVLSLGEPVFFNKTKTSSFAEAFAVCFVLSSAAVRLFSSEKSKKTVTVCFEAGGEKTELSALVDSGSLVREPISSLPVVIVSYKALPEINSGIKFEEKQLRIRMIPIKSVGGEKLLTGYVPDKISIDGKEVSAVIAIDKENESFGGHGGIVPSCLSEK